MLPEIPENKDAPKPKERPIVNLNAKPSLSITERVWLYAMILAVTSFFASTWLVIFGVIEPRQILVYTVILLFATILKPNRNR